MTSPSVSVVLPTYNRAAILPRAINSVLEQSYSALELLVVDDCSTDETELVLSKIKDPRLKVIRLEVNSGPGAARNAGIRTSSGQYIAFQDSDDEWSPEKLRKQVTLLDQCDDTGHYPAACYSRFIVSRGKKRILRPSDPKSVLSGRIYERLLYGNTMGTPAVLFRREILNIVGAFDESLANLEDWDLALRIALDHSIAFLDEVTLISYDSPGSVNKVVSPESQVAILHKHYESYKALPKAMAHITWCIGTAYATLQQRKEALHYMEISLNHFPTTRKRLLFAALRSGVTPYRALRSMRSVLEK